MFGTVFGRHHLAFIYQWLVYNVVPYEEWEGGISIDRHPPQAVLMHRADRTHLQPLAVPPCTDGLDVGPSAGSNTVAKPLVPSPES